MTFVDWFTSVSVVLVGILGILNYFGNRKTSDADTRIKQKVANSDSDVDLNNAVKLAYERALMAEEETQRRIVAHEKAIAQIREEWRIETESMRTEIAALRAQLETIAYEIQLVAHLGPDEPKVEKVLIKRLPIAPRL